MPHRPEDDETRQAAVAQRYAERAGGELPEELRERMAAEGIEPGVPAVPVVVRGQIGRLEVDYSCPEHGAWRAEKILRGPVNGEGPWTVEDEGTTVCPQCDRPGKPDAESRRQARAYGVSLVDPTASAFGTDLELMIDALAHEQHDGLYLPLHKMIVPGSGRLGAFALDDDEVRVTLVWDRSG